MLILDTGKYLINTGQRSQVFRGVGYSECGTKSWFASGGRVNYVRYDEVFMDNIRKGKVQPPDDPPITLLYLDPQGLPTTFAYIVLLMLKTQENIPSQDPHQQTDGSWKCVSYV